MTSHERKIECSEFIIILLFAIFGIVWMLYIVPQIQYSDFFINLNPIQTYLIYNTGIIAAFVAMFGIPVGYFIKGKIDILNSVRGGFASFIGFSFFVDMLSTPFAWSAAGDLVITPTPDNIEKASVDYMVGWIFQQIGVHGSILYLSVYVLVPIISVVVMAFILKPKELLKLFNH